MSKKHSYRSAKFMLKKNKKLTVRLIKKRFKYNQRKLRLLEERNLKVLDYRKKLRLYNNFLKNSIKRLNIPLHLLLKDKKFSFLTIYNKVFSNRLLFKNAVHICLKNKRYLRSDFFNLTIRKVVLNIQKINKKENWIDHRFWIIKKKGKLLKKKLRVRLLHNPNIEINKDKYACTLISKEFLSSPKFLKSKPFSFSKKINKFIKYFF